MDVPNDFDRELERELHRWLDPAVAAPIPPRTVPARAGFTIKFLARAGTALAAKLVVGVAVAVLAAGLAGVATEAVITRSLNPVDWSQQARQQVQTLGSQPAPGVDQHHAVASPAGHLAGASDGTGSQPATGQPAPLTEESPQPNSAAVPAADPTASSQPTPPKCAGCFRTESPAPADGS
jgi:hypothetical protein